MINMNRNSIIRSIVLMVVILTPLVTQSQMRDTEVRTLHREIDMLSETVAKLEAEQARAHQFDYEMNTPHTGFSKRDSIRLLRLRRKQVESRQRIDQLTQEIIHISKQLEDPNKRYALAKKMKAPKVVPTDVDGETTPDSTRLSEVISTRSIDLSAVKLVRKGKSLDQARLIIIDELTPDQVLRFYQNLEKIDRYELYDIADDIVLSDHVELVDARRSAIYFYLFTK